MNTEETAQTEHHRLKAWLGLLTGAVIIVVLNWHGLLMQDSLLLYSAEKFIDFVYRSNGWHYVEFGRDMNQRHVEIGMYVLLNVTLTLGVWNRRVILGTIPCTMLIGFSSVVARLVGKTK